MTKFIDLTDIHNLNQKLSLLTADTLPLWGKLRAQNMIEHLIEAVQESNGKRLANLKFPPEQAVGMKQFMVYSEFEMPKHQKGTLSDNSKTLRLENLQLAIGQLNKELAAFEEYFSENGKTAMHAAFGELNHDEWLRWHGKHFTHHFKQFGLL